MPSVLFDPSWYWNVELKWSRPVDVSYDFDGLPDHAEENHGLYRFERHHHHLDNGPEIIRIGVAFEQTLATRLRQYSTRLDDYRRLGSLRVSHALLTIDGQQRRARYEAVEHLLILLVQPIENEKKRSGIPDGFYKITNTGHRGKLPRELVFPAKHVKW
jgi:hypothetical protein